MTLVESNDQKSIALDDVKRSGSSATVDLSDPDRDFDALATSSVIESKLMRKIDLYIIPWLALLYLLNFLDRSNIGNAKLYNIEKDLHITDSQYLIALTCFFFPYALFDVYAEQCPIEKAKAFKMAFVPHTHVGHRHDKCQVTDCDEAVRILLGLFESGLYPGIAFYMSCWYKRSELGSRIALFFTSATVAGAFGGLLAAAIENMDGIGGKPGWAWIFIIEGLFTVVIAIASFWVVQDFPETAKFLTEEERAFVINRLQSDQQHSAGGEVFQMNGLFAGGLVGYIILIASRNAALSYFACFLGASGIYPLIPNSVLLTSAWVSANTEGSYKRSAVLGMAIGWGNLNGAVTSNVYRARDKPWYSLGHGIVLAYICIGLSCSLLLRIVLKAENGRRERGERDEVIGMPGSALNTKDGARVYESVEAARIDKGDDWSGFRYTL
ncbi:hypothetical protein EW145_g3739 [Phellinidium pouzarii]|uniref:Major facilitator superfamily (MFS) profile domain-containing protein n=1 Tax=Phellinidium pouzarii TaxID=167371 RepID=A0A4S4L625_9AGAM|nr:hypothetical protein EW145_g3739 [Phellinidium pouzarii]